MLSATWFRYVSVLRRSPVDTVSMLVRPLVSALLYFLFAQFYLAGSAGVGYLCLSLAVVNLVTNAAAGGAFEAKEDTRDDRFDSVLLAPGGLAGFVVAEALIQTAIALVESLVVVAIAWPWLRADAAGVAWAVAGTLALCALCVAWTSVGVLTTVRSGNTIQVTFVTSLAVTLGGAFWPVESLPAVLGAVARVNPLTYPIDLIRASLTGGSYLAEPGIELAVTVGAAVAVGMLAAALMARRRDLSGLARV